MKTYYESELKELQGKKFTDVKELEKAEAEVNKEVKKKQELAAQRKADAQVVDEAIKNEVAVKKSVLDKKDKLREEYYKAKNELDKKYFADKHELELELDEATKKVSTALKEFCQAHPEGYHSTLKFDDGSTQTYSYNYKEDRDTSFIDLLDFMFKPFWF